MKRAKYLLAFTALTLMFSVVADEKRNKNGSNSGNTICIASICFEGFGNGSGFNPSRYNRISDNNAFQARDSGFSVPNYLGGGGGIRPTLSYGNGDGGRPQSSGNGDGGRPKE